MFSYVAFVTGYAYFTVLDTSLVNSNILYPFMIPLFPIDFFSYIYRLFWYGLALAKGACQELSCQERLVRDVEISHRTT